MAARYSWARAEGLDQFDEEDEVAQGQPARAGQFGDEVAHASTARRSGRGTADGDDLSGEDGQGAPSPGRGRRSVRG
jgi:hypothetical protein